MNRFSTGDVVRFANGSSRAVVTAVHEGAITVRWDWGQESTMLACLACDLIIFDHVATDVVANAARPLGAFKHE